MRDATRGGVATILNEMARASNVAMVVDEEAVPVRPEVAGPARSWASTRCTSPARGGSSPWSTGPGDAALAALRAQPLGERAAIIGRIKADPAGLVLLKTVFGGTRIVDMLVGDPLPRIC